MRLTLEEAIARIEANPLLMALSQICDLGTCAGPKRGGFQRALDIASAALEAGVHSPEISRDTSAEVASIAGELLNIDEATLDTLDSGTADSMTAADLLAKIRTVAASALGQRQ